MCSSTRDTIRAVCQGLASSPHEAVHHKAFELVDAIVGSAPSARTREVAVRCALEQAVSASEATTAG